MTTWFWTIFLLLGVINYILFTRKIYSGLGKLKAIDKDTNSSYPHVSVIVPARNEEVNIEETLQSLAQQIYPIEKIQVVLVNDRSTDQTSGIMSKYAEGYSHFKKIDINDLPTGISPKKNAINTGIMETNGDIIITTDADCTHSPNWITNLVKYFEPDIGLVAGLTVFTKNQNSLIHRLHALDFLSHSFIGAGAIGAGDGMNCTGANLAYRRKAYMELQGYGDKKHMVSGDDEFFLHRLIQNGKWNVVHTSEEDLTVYSKPPKALKDILHQRSRWGSKGIYYPLKIKFVASGIFTYYLMLVLSPLIVLTSSLNISIYLFCVFIKILSDLMVISKGCKVFRLKLPIRDFILLSLIHPLLIIVTAIQGHFFPFQWKGEFYRSKMPKK